MCMCFSASSALTDNVIVGYCDFFHFVNITDTTWANVRFVPEMNGVRVQSANPKPRGGSRLPGFVPNHSSCYFDTDH